MRCGDGGLDYMLVPETILDSGQIFELESMQTAQERKGLRKTA